MQQRIDHILQRLIAPGAMLMLAVLVACVG
jgi:hypothetical protein